MFYKVMMPNQRPGAKHHLLSRSDRYPFFTNACDDVESWVASKEIQECDWFHRVKTDGSVEFSFRSQTDAIEFKLTFG